MAAMTGLWMRGAGTAPLANTNATSATSSETDTATISANDFLTLLVTEMQNQDPTAATDPNEYINQLVNVNSLEQLISINETLSSATEEPTKPTQSSTPGAESRMKSSPGRVHAAISSHNSAKVAGSETSSIAAAQSVAARMVQGNLNIPKASGAASAVAHALTRH